jgi:subfamily B ATP-binding cassette protein MsbA
LTRARPQARKRNGFSNRTGLAVTGARDEVRLFLRLFAYTKPYRVRLAFSWVATAVFAAASAGLIYQLKPIFDLVLILGVNVTRVSLAILVLYAIKGVAAYLATTLVASVGQRAVTDLRNALYEHVLNQSFTFLSRHSTGTLMSHITTDVEKIQNAVADVAGDLLKEGLTVLGLVVVLFYMDYRLALVALVGMPLVVHPLVRFGRKLRMTNET